MSAPARCLCGHGPSRHYHLDASTACRICASCHTYRPRCTEMVWPRGRFYMPVAPSQCTRTALGNSGLCRQHGGQA